MKFSIKKKAHQKLLNFFYKLNKFIIIINFNLNIIIYLPELCDSFKLRCKVYLLTALASRITYV